MGFVKMDWRCYICEIIDIYIDTMKRRGFLVAGIVFFMGSVQAQNEVFDKCYQGLDGGNATTTDVSIVYPQGFHVVDKDGVDVLVVNNNYKPSDALYESDRVIALHPVTLESDSGEGVLLYPVVSSTIPMLHGTPERELHAALGDGDKDVSGSIRKIKLDDMSQYGNADVAYIYDMKLPEPYMGKYANCTGVYLRKYAHPALLMKVITTDEGMAKKDEYLHKLLGSVKYGYAITSEGVKMESVAKQDSMNIVNHVTCRHVNAAKK